MQVSVKKEKNLPEAPHSIKKWLPKSVDLNGGMERHFTDAFIV